MIDWQPPEATYLAWLDCRRSGLDDPRESLLAEGRVALEPGPRFGLGGAGHVRLNFGTSTEILDAATARMAAVFTPSSGSAQRARSESQAR
jgi:cystathionine beta-lyase